MEDKINQKVIWVHLWTDIISSLVGLPLETNRSDVLSQCDINA